MPEKNKIVDKYELLQVCASMKARRIRKKISASVIANKLGIGKSAFSKYEQGVVDISITKMIAWCDALGVSPRYPGQVLHNFRTKNKRS